MKTLNEILTDSYQTFIKDYFALQEEKAVNEMKNLSAEQQEAVYNQILVQYESNREEVEMEWENTPLEVLNGRTPLDMITHMEDMEELVALFVFMAEQLQNDIPVSLKERFRQCGQEGIHQLKQIAQSCVRDEGQVSYVYSAAVGLLGELKLPGGVEALIELAYGSENEETVLEHVEEALRTLGSISIEPVLQTLNGRNIGTVEKMLLYVLACAGANHHNDSIYQMLRKAFRSMDDKSMALLCFTVYGDGRAVPLLRGYLNQNPGLPPKIFYETIGVIQKLGGQIEEYLKA